MPDTVPTLAVFRNPAFRNLWVATLASNFGGIVQGIGAAWLMTELTGSHTLVAMIHTSVAIPVMVFGLVAGVIPNALDRLAAEEGAGDPATWRSWIGPVNGACCYEVGWEVAEEVAAATTREAVVEHSGAGGGSSGERPFLDLVAAARHQLTAAGMPVSWLVRCTRCDADGLFSYRRSGQRAGRNLAFIWKE